MTLLPTYLIKYVFHDLQHRYKDADAFMEYMGNQYACMLSINVSAPLEKMGDSESHACEISTGFLIPLLQEVNNRIQTYIQ